jgi:xanthine dehydrogenase accessory factor
VSKELELWQFVATRLERRENVMLLVVAESSGSSPGRQGYKMAVGTDGELVGSIGGGVMEVTLVEQSRGHLASKMTPRSPEAGNAPAPPSEGSLLKHQVHRKNDPNASGMICSGKQTIIFKLLTPEDRDHANAAARSIEKHKRRVVEITPQDFSVEEPPEGGTSNSGTPNFVFEKPSDSEFLYRELLGEKNDLFIVGGGHCALALSELMSKMDFRISIFDDRPELNTLQKNEFADEIKIVSGYDRIAEHIPSSSSAYVVVMTLGYKSDAIVIRCLIDKDFKYFGVLGSKAKMATLMKELRAEGLPAKKLDRIRTPVGLPINSRSPEEIAVSIAAEIISVKNRENA